MMPPILVQYLSQPEPGKFHDELLEHCKDLVKLSRDEMESYYERWDEYDMSWRAQREPDKADLKAGERGEPQKLVLPVTHTQIETFVAFCVQVYTQRPSFYELSGTGTEDIAAAKVAEAVLDHNLRHNKFKGDKLPQFLRNVAKFGFGVLKHSWTEETKMVEKLVPQQIQMPDGQVLDGPASPQIVEEPCYQGNAISVISPYRFFPDPRVPLTKFNDGEFCASEDDYSKHHLKKLERKGLVAGVEQIEPFKADMAESYKRRVGFSSSERSPSSGKDHSKHYFVVTEIELELIPSAWEVMPGVPLGTSQEYEKYVVWYANDNRLIRVEPKNYLHGKFNYDVAQYHNDDLTFINCGVAELISAMQDVQNWMINSHILSVRKVISNMLIVDPKGVEMSDLDNRRPVLRLKPSVQGSGVDRWIKQLAVSDVTQNHVNDVKVLEEFVQATTGISENVLGQFASGRRSATEVRNVNSNAAARLMLAATAIWEHALLPLGDKMLGNCRDGMTLPQLVKVLGVSNVQNNQLGVQQFILADKSQLVGNFDFLIFDGTLPSMKGAMAQQLQELLTVMMGNPETAFVFQLNPTALLMEMLHLRGIRNVDQFRLDQNQAQQLIQLAGTARNAAATVNAQGGGGQPPGSGAQPGAR